MWPDRKKTLLASALGALGLLGLSASPASACHLCGRAHLGTPVMVLQPTVTAMPTHFVLVTTGATGTVAQPTGQMPTGGNPPQPAQPQGNQTFPAPLPPIPPDVNPKPTQPNADQNAPDVQGRENIRQMHDEPTDVDPNAAGGPGGSASLSPVPASPGARPRTPAELDQELGRLQARMVALLYKKRLMEAAADLEKPESSAEVVLKELDEKILKDLRSSPLNLLLDARKIDSTQKPQLAKLLRDVAIGID